MKNKKASLKGYEAEILADSINECGSRLTTFRLRYPRFIHSELMTHRTHSRNAGSSRAIPTKRFRKQVLKNPALPVHWGKIQKGMQADNQLKGIKCSLAKAVWNGARYPAVLAHWYLEKLDLHKQLANRILEPWMWMESIFTATEDGWNNWIFLRSHKDAQPEFQHLTNMIVDKYNSSKPKLLKNKEAHLPFYDSELDCKLEMEDIIKTCTGRVARVSYLTHSGKRDPKADIHLHDRLINTGEGQPKHLSPFEHIAFAISGVKNMSGNFSDGWVQYRKLAEGPCVGNKVSINS